MNFTSDRDDSEVVPEGTKVEFTCTVEADPVPMIEIYSDDGTSIATASVAGTELKLEVTLTQEQHQLGYFCRMTGTDPGNSVDSSSIIYSVECKKNFHCYLVLHSILKLSEESSQCIPVKNTLFLKFNL